jgi:competence protein ComFC
VPNRLLPKLLGFLFPTRCVVCGAKGSLLCQECAAKLPALDKEFCIVCDKPAVGGFTHPICATRYTPERVLSGFWYRGSVPKVIGALKFKGLYPLGVLLADLLVENLKERGITFGGEALLVPVPLSFWRKGSRGYNQAELLARGLGEQLNLEVDPSALRKTKDTEPLAQKGVTREERKRRVRGVFAVPKRKEKAIKGKDILLVDDTLTSGATTREATRVLKRAGARQVWVLTFAKQKRIRAK